jgi:hypothetical protein
MVLDFTFFISITSLKKWYNIQHSFIPLLIPRSSYGERTFNYKFTDQDDIVPSSGVERILNTGVANTLAGNDTITGFGEPYKYYNPRGSGIFNSGTLNTAEGDDIITGTGGLHGIDNSGRLNTAEGNDIITGKGRLTALTTPAG